jgi:hypothetical protein
MDEHDRHVAIDWARVALGLGHLLLAVAALVYVIYIIVAPTRAVPFDADSVRCYERATHGSCIQVLPHP